GLGKSPVLNDSANPLATPNDPPPALDCSGDRRGDPTGPLPNPPKPERDLADSAPEPAKDDQNH
ncbi:hypothetical protein T484DRAFT_1869748, partial [Baffinella frigidus]